MAENTNKKIFAWLGVSCSTIILLITICPCSCSMLGFFTYLSDPSTWYQDDSVALAFLSGFSFIGFLLALVIGGASIYYLVKNKKKNESKSIS